MTLTKSEEEVYIIINDFIKKNGYSPSVREIGTMLGGRSSATVWYHLKRLKEKGFINYIEGKNRTITIL